MKLWWVHKGKITDLPRFYNSEASQRHGGRDTWLEIWKMSERTPIKKGEGREFQANDFSGEEEEGHRGEIESKS